MTDTLWEIEHWFIPGDIVEITVEDDVEASIECAFCGMSDEHEIHWSTPDWFVELIAAADDLALDNPHAIGSERYLRARAHRGQD